MEHEHDPEMTECRECGTTFDLARQHYHDNLCPSCMEEENPERSWPGCAKCGDKIPPDERATWRVGGRTGTELLPVHEDCKPDGNGGARTFAGP